MEFPIIMCKGDALTPQRFWGYREVTNQREYNRAIADGYVVSSRNKSK